MPFTFSHPAIILPLTYLPQKWSSLTGLVIGSIAPDFEYFLRMKIKSEYSHTIEGLFWFNLPLGIALAFIFHNIVRDTLFDNLPKLLKSRLLVYKHFDWNEHFKNRWIVVIISILVGSASHILWDGFTHAHGYFVQQLPALTESITFMGVQLPVMKVLQHSSTLIGGLIIVIAIYKLPKMLLVKNSISLQYWLILIGMALSILAIRLINGLEINQYGDLVVTIISATFASLIVTSILFKLKKRTD